MAAWSLAVSAMEFHWHSTYVPGTELGLSTERKEKEERNWREVDW
jgi:hypothetical protein